MRVYTSYRFPIFSLLIFFSPGQSGREKDFIIPPPKKKKEEEKKREKENDKELKTGSTNVYLK